VSQMHLPIALLVFICQCFGDTVRFCTEYIRDKYTFRCHPGFQSGSVIYHWMTVKFEANEEGTEFDVFPCRLAAVIVMPTSDILHTGSTVLWFNVPPNARPLYPFC
jgi:hypothetical protein